MADQAPDRTKSKWLWILILALLLIAVIAFVVNPMGGVDPEDVAEEGVATTPDIGYTPAPTGAGVDVTLPDGTVTDGAAATPGAAMGATGTATDPAP